MAEPLTFDAATAELVEFTIDLPVHWHEGEVMVQMRWSSSRPDPEAVDG